MALCIQCGAHSFVMTGNKTLTSSLCVKIIQVILLKFDCRTVYEVILLNLTSCQFWHSPSYLEFAVHGRRGFHWHRVSVGVLRLLC